MITIFKIGDHVTWKTYTRKGKKRQSFIENEGHITEMFNRMASMKMANGAVESAFLSELKLVNHNQL